MTCFNSYVIGTNKQGRYFALSTNNQSNTSLNAPRTLPRTVSRDSDVERSLRGLTDDESVKSQSLRGRNKSKGRYDVIITSID